MSDHQIRQASQSDLDAICAIENEAFTDPYPRFLFRRLLREYKSTFFVASSSEDKIAGYCIASVDGGSAHLISIAVAIGQRRVGIGGGLMEGLLDYLRERGIGELWLEVKPENRDAIGFYAKFGFVRVSVVPNYYSDRSDAVRMRKALVEKSRD